MHTWLSSLTRRAAVVLLLSGCTAAPVLGPGAPAAWSAPVDPTACPAPASGTLADFFDKAVPGGLARDRAPGAVVSVVAGDQTVFAKGYGLADTQRDVKFDPDRSLVRIGSVTKLFTWTAVMQQVEAGRLELDADVNRYLTAFKIPRTYPKPVTLRTLMNHTAGFEDRVIGTGARTAADVAPLGDYLAHHMPARIRPPGLISAYSNYGAALAGYIVSRVNGEPYDAYVQRHLLTPLGMTRSTATEPVPAALAADLARSYDSDSNPPKDVPFTFDAIPPDGSISATADDMAHFMIAQLNGGRFRDNSILKPATVAQMHLPSFAADPRLGGYALGFMNRTVNGHQVLMHDGSWEGFQTELVMVPQCHLGLFVSANGTLPDLITAFLDRFAPRRTHPDPVSAPQSTSPATRTSPRPGFYIPTRHNASTLEKVAALQGEEVRLTVDAKGTVHFKGKDWKPQGGGLYAPADGSDHLVFLSDKDQQHYVATDGPAYELVGTSSTPVFNLGVLLVFLTAALSAPVIPLTALWRRTRRRPATLTRTWRTARALAAGATTLGLAFLVLITAQLLNSGDLIYGATTGLRAVLLLPFVMLAVTAAAAVWTVRGWRGSGAGVIARTHQLVLFTGLTALTWFLLQWNLMGWQF
ncbi:serine hydrolase domain-containing protein [Streptomyces sp. NPDC051366]|uniref:serine hydrolase domain-containing protein n=1 Tax=Streptomyces sp. NPDC051366 TaxID=3365652 RepID=UPI0037873A56